MSIRLRLTLLFTAVLAVTLVIFGGVLYLQLSRNLHAEVDRSLTSRADREFRFVAGPSPRATNAGPAGPPARNADAGRRAAAAVASYFSDPTIFQQVTDGRGQLCFRSGQDDETLPQPSSTGRRHFETVSSNNVRLRMLVVPLGSDLPLRASVSCQSLQTPFTELLARSLGDADSTLNRLRVLLLAGTALSLAVAAGGGWLLARNALRPMDRLTAEAQSIGRRQDFKRRVEHRGTNDEVGRLAATFNGMLDSLDAAHERLQRALEAQRRFVADASHELRTPLTTIRGNVDLLRLEEQDSGPDQQEALSDIATEAERMSRLVNNLLALARADSGLHLTRRPVEVQPVVAEVFQKAARLADHVDLRLGETAYASVLGDRDYLVQLLFILADNALKYTPAGGTVTISVGCEGRMVRIAVADTGAGIAREEQPRIFDRFYRADPSRHGDGTGLGLSIARWIAQELSGSIELESEPGKGSTFTIVLPALAAGQAPEPAVAHTSAQ